MNLAKSLTQPRLLAKNTLLNIVGYGAPLLVAVVAIPIIVNALGKERFGILTLAWVLIGYLSLFDLGIGRALTKIVAEKLGDGREEEIPSTIWTGMSVMGLLGFGIAILFGASNHWLVYDFLKIPETLKIETVKSFYLLAALVPVVIVSVGFRGILVSYQRFDLVNSVRVPLGIFVFVAPLAVIPFSLELSHIIGVLFFGRVIAATVQFIFCWRIVDNLLVGFVFKARVFGEILRFGGWMTVTNVISPILVYLDRFFIGSLLSVSAVAFYATPSEVLTKLMFISGALTNVLFPAISSSYKVDRRHSALLLERGLKYVFITILPMVLVIVCFASDGLRFWLNEEFMQNSLMAAQILAVGVLIACLGQVPYAFIQGAGRPDLTAKLHLCELPLYVLVLTGAINWAGITGAAIVWTLRMVVDTSCMYLIAQRLLGRDRLRNRSKVISMLVALTCLVVLAVDFSITYKTILCLFFMVLFAWIVHRYLLSAEEIDFIRSMLNMNREHEVPRRG